MRPAKKYFFTDRFFENPEYWLVEGGRPLGMMTVIVIIFF